MNEIFRYTEVNVLLDLSLHTGRDCEEENGESIQLQREVIYRGVLSSSGIYFIGF